MGGILDKLFINDNWPSYSGYIKTLNIGIFKYSLILLDLKILSSIICLPEFDFFLQQQNL